MKKTISRLSVLLFSVAVMGLAACHKDAAKVTTSGSSTGDIMTDQTVTASVQGRVVDENGVPMSGATVTSGTVTTATDVNGVFTFTNISMSSRFGYVQVSKSGYFNGSRSITCKDGQSNYVQIQMIPRAETSSFAASSGGSVTIGTGNSAVFAASSVVTASTNAAYTGTVHVFTKYLDPTDSLLFQYMPGDLRGIDSSGKETALQSFGMLIVELQGDAGEKLQLASGKTATLTWKIPTALLANAPSTIPLWYFNDSTGKWIEQGVATKVGSSYVGTVSHFTAWNVDTPLPTVSFTVRLVDQSGNPLAYTDVVMAVDGEYIGSGYTDQNGYREGLMVKGATVNLMVWDNCHYTVAAETVGPVLADENLGTLTVTLSHPSIVIKGSVVDCSSTAVDSGLVKVTIGSLIYQASVVKGAFVLPLTYNCFGLPQSFTITPYNLATSQGGQTQTVSITGTDTTDAGVLSVPCGASAGSVPAGNIQITFNGQTYTWQTATQDFIFNPDYVNNMSTLDCMPFGSTGMQIFMMANNIMSSPGIYTTYIFTLNDIPGYVDLGCTNIVINVTNAGVPVTGGAVVATITGTVTNNTTGATYPMTGGFNIGWTAVSLN